MGVEMRFREALFLHQFFAVAKDNLPVEGEGEAFDGYREANATPADLTLGQATSREHEKAILELGRGIVDELGAETEYVGEGKEQELFISFESETEPGEQVNVTSSPSSAAIATSESD